jgi:hypothetical protein
MPTYPVLQPDGMIAIWSTVVDNFLGFGYTVDEATDELLTRTSSPRDMVKGYTQDVAAGRIPFDWWSDWPERVAWATLQQGEEDEGVKGAMALTPDPMTRRFIEQFVMTCRAEGKQQDAEYELQRANEKIKKLEERLSIYST